MLNELIKIQNDLGKPRQSHGQQASSLVDGNEADVSADPNDWVAETPSFGFYHQGYTTNHWLQVFRSG